MKINEPLLLVDKQTSVSQYETYTLLNKTQVKMLHSGPGICTYVHISFQLLCTGQQCDESVDQRKNFERDYAEHKINFFFKNYSLNYEIFFYNKCYISYKNIV